MPFLIHLPMWHDVLRFHDLRHVFIGFAEENRFRLWRDCRRQCHLQREYAGIRGFVILTMLFSVAFISSQCWFLEIIYRFYLYLEERESSFAFNLEPEFSVS